MKNILKYTAILAAIIINSASLISKTSNNNVNQKFQLQLIVNNNTWDVNGENVANWPTTDIIWFYFDVTIDNITYDDNEFVSQNINNSNFNSNFHTGFGTTNVNKYPDIFWTNSNSELTLYTLNLDPSSTNTKINFTFGIFRDPYHYQNTYANNYLYDFHKTYSDNKNNGTKLIINANGDWGSNTANWGFQYYKF